MVQPILIPIGPCASKEDRVSTTRTNSFRRSSSDHFEPQVADDPQAQRRLRGQLEHIDYTAFASNREVIAAGLGHADAGKFQRLAVAAALARTRWVSEALAMSGPQGLTAEQVAHLSQLRGAYEELTEAYEAMRRMVERGYLTFRTEGGR
jgi:hypothetical protein